MRWAGMLDGDPELATGIKVVTTGCPVRRRRTPRVNEACVVLHLVQSDDLVKVDDPVAEVLDIWGRPLGDGVLRSEQEGFVVGRSQGIYFYPGQAVLSMAIRDEAPLMAPYPEGIFKEKPVG
jgi:predicted deacylase